MKSVRAAPVLLVALAAVLLSRRAAAQVPEYKLKAEFLERFTRFVEWPGEESDETPFNVCVLGTSPFGSHLDEMAVGRKTKGRALKVEELKSVDQTSHCQILFVPASERASLAKVIARTADHPILTVGDTEGFAERGVILNFYASEDTIRFEVNEEAARRSGLRLSSKLLKLARIVHPTVDEERR